MKRAILVLKNAKIPKEIEGTFYGIDQGALQCVRAERPCAMAIGDFDSVNDSEFQEIKNNSTTIRKLNCKKDQSDTAEAVELVLNEDFDEVVLLGGLFGRFDHTWANFLLLQKFP